jgi:ribosomal protein S27AE
MNISADWASVLTKAGAKRCPKCGEMSIISAHIPDGPDDGKGKNLAPKRSPLSYCFECGYEESQLS